MSFTLSPDQELAAQTIVARTLAVMCGDATDNVLTLVGNAGTGKTTIMREVAKRVEAEGVGVEYMAPTGKAAARLKESLGDADVTTIHGRLYGAPTEVGLCPACEEWSRPLGVSREEQIDRKTPWTCPDCATTFDPEDPEVADFKTKLIFAAPEDGMVCGAGDLLICDEASMVSDKVAADIRRALPARAVLLYVGDDGQLPPVEGTWGADFASPTAKLTQVHRQAADSPIVSAATLVREGGGKAVLKHKDQDGEDRWNVFQNSTLDAAAQWLAVRRAQKIDATLLAYTNKTRRALNTLVREHTGAIHRSAVNGIPLNEGDKIVVTANNHAAGIMNGEVFTVTTSEWYDDHKTIVRVALAESAGERLILADAIGDDPRDYKYKLTKLTRAFSRAKREWENTSSNVMELEDYLAREGVVDVRGFLCVDYGECLTVHKSQGSQWTEAALVWDRSLWGSFFRDPATWARLVYTAITRAADRFDLILLRKGES